MLSRTNIPKKNSKAFTCRIYSTIQGYAYGYTRGIPGIPSDRWIPALAILRRRIQSLGLDLQMAFIPMLRGHAFYLGGVCYVKSNVVVSDS